MKRESKANQTYGRMNARVIALAAALALSMGGVSLAQTAAPAGATVASDAIQTLPGGRVIALARNTAGTQLASVVERMGVYIGTVSNGGIQWRQEAFPATAGGAAGSVKSLFWDASGELWAAAEGFGLWKRTAVDTWAQVRGAGNEIGDVVLSVSAGQDARPMVATFSGLYQLNANRTNWTLLAPQVPSVFSRAVRASAAANASVAAFSNGDVFLLNAQGKWIGTNLNKFPRDIAFDINGVLHAATADGVYRYNARHPVLSSHFRFSSFTKLTCPQFVYQ